MEKLTEIKVTPKGEGARSHTVSHTPTNTRAHTHHHDSDVFKCEGHRKGSSEGKGTGSRTAS